MALPPLHMKAKKRFGQNFLVDDYIIEQIVNAINPKKGEYLLEIGPGHAALTRPVLERAEKLTAIELDRDIAEMLRHDPFLKGLNLIEGDALKIDYESLEGAGSLRIFGNLPYNITSPIIFHLLNQKGIIDMHFMLQKEVVERLCAGPDNKDYGRLTVMTQYQAQVIPMLEVPPRAFRPMPKVYSAVVRLKPLPLSDKERALIPMLNTLTTQAFSARRKTIRNSLGKFLNSEEFATLGIDTTLRAENLSVEQYKGIALYLKQRDKV